MAKSTRNCRTVKRRACNSEIVYCGTLQLNVTLYCSAFEDFWHVFPTQINRQKCRTATLMVCGHNIINCCCVFFGMSSNHFCVGMSTRQQWDVSLLVYQSVSFSFINQSINQPIGMNRMRWFLAVLRSLLHSSLSYTFSCHSSLPTILRSSLTSSSHLFLGLPLGLIVSKFMYNTLLGILFSSILCTCPNQSNLCSLIVSVIVGFLIFA